MVVRQKNFPGWPEFPCHGDPPVRHDANGILERTGIQPGPGVLEDAGRVKIGAGRVNFRSASVRQSC